MPSGPIRLDPYEYDTPKVEAAPSGSLVYKDGCDASCGCELRYGYKLPKVDDVLRAGSPLVIAQGLPQGILVTGCEEHGPELPRRVEGLLDDCHSSTDFPSFERACAILAEALATV